MSDSVETVPISSLFFDGPGPHVVRAGYPRHGARGSLYTPARGSELKALIDTSILQLGGISGDARRKTPAPAAAPVAIDTLLYNGPRALERAMELRQQIIESQGRPTDDQLDELLDLVALAASA